jgi:phage terminase small subunit
MPANLSPRRERFCQEVAKGQTLADAYRLAGYSGTTKNASTLRRDPEIERRVNELISKRQSIDYAATQRAIERLAITKESLAREYVPLVTSNMRNYLVDVGNQVAFDFSQVTPEQWKAVKALQVDEYMDGKGDSAREVKRVKLWLHDKVGPGQLIAKLFGWIIERRKDETDKNERLAGLSDAQRLSEAIDIIARAREALALSGPDTIENNQTEPREASDEQPKR